MVDIKDPTYFFSQSGESGVYLDRAEVIGCQGGGERAMNSISYAGFIQLSCSFVLVYTRFEYQWLFPTPHNQFPPVNHKVHKRYSQKKNILGRQLGNNKK